MAANSASGGYLERPKPSGLADVIEIILDKGIVIDAYVRVSLIGIELITIDARIVIASVDTYLRFAEAVGRLNIADDDSQGLPELMESMTSGGAKSKTKGALEGAKDSLSDLFSSDDDEDDEDDGESGAVEPHAPSLADAAAAVRQAAEVGDGEADGSVADPARGDGGGKPGDAPKLREPDDPKDSEPKD
jgi:hypothetical protein